ncbi:MAG TPA: gamma-glutamyl-gamma-aminobutyrate hydrolase family protein [Gemmatimonadales bacterium]|jgi:putative glutamine amidotransferase|nr:gamma-glutamyl-gamma-aminobutyrate hydrolase family protein [Gemmatimonadales bacterium]
MSRPRIGVAGVTRESNGQTRTGVNVNYVRAVLAAGGLPILMLPEFSVPETVELFGECDALLLTGGEDVSPEYYSAAPHPKLGTVDQRRDVNELALIAEARARDLPILGICRGIQICNVAFGGTLIQDIPSERPGTLDHDPAGARAQRSHRVDIEEPSRLAEIMGVTSLDCNSFHHQAVDRIGDGLLATARSPDGLVEGLESANHDDWIVAVQWHPEELAFQPDASELKLFSALIAAARRR